MTKMKSFTKSALSMFLVVLMLFSVFPAAIQAEAISKPAQVKNVKTTSVTYNSVKLKWLPVSGKGNYYTVFSYNTKTKKYTNLATTTSTTYTVKNLNPNTSYNFAVQAFRKYKETKYWGKISTKLTVKTKSISAVQPILTSIKAGPGGITIEWNKMPGTTFYRVYRREKTEKSYSKLCDTTSLKYTDKTVTSGKLYYYRVRVFVKLENGYAYSKRSEFKKLRTNYPATASNVSVEYKKTYLKVSWDKVDGATGYQVYRSTTGEKGSYIKVITTSKNYYNDKNLNNKNTYYYKIRAYRVADSKNYFGKYSISQSGTLKITYKSCNKLMYAAKDVPIKKSPNDSSKIVETLKKNHGILTIGIGNNGWNKIIYTDSQIGYIESKYLTDSPEKRVEFYYWDKNQTRYKVDKNGIEWIDLPPWVNPGTPANPEDLDWESCYACGRRDCVQSMNDYYCVICKKTVKGSTCHPKSHFNASH